MTGCFREINFLQGSWMPLYSKACLNNCGKSVPATRKLDPSYSSYVRPPEDSEKHVVPRLDCSFCLPGGSRTYGAVVSEYLGLKTALSTWCKTGRAHLWKAVLPKALWMVLHEPAVYLKCGWWYEKWMSGRKGAKGLAQATYRLFIHRKPVFTHSCE